MPTLKDIQEEIDTRNKILKILQSCPVEESSCEICMKVLETYYSLAYQAGIDMILKEIEGMERKDKWGDREGDGWAGCCGQEEIVGWNQGLSSLKEKIISNSK